MIEDRIEALLVGLGLHVKQCPSSEYALPMMELLRFCKGDLLDHDTLARMFVEIEKAGRIVIDDSREGMLDVAANGPPVDGDFVLLLSREKGWQLGTWESAEGDDASDIVGYFKLRSFR